MNEQVLKEKIQSDVKNALKSGDSKKRMVLGMVLAAIKNKEIEKRSELSDDEVVTVVASEIKKRKDSVEQYEKGSRPELAEGERKEAEMLMDYMPEQMSEDEIRELVRQTIKEMALPAGALAKAGQVLGTLMPKLKGRADGQTVSRIVREELST